MDQMIPVSPVVSFHAGFLQIDLHAAYFFGQVFLCGQFSGRAGFRFCEACSVRIFDNLCKKVFPGVFQDGNVRPDAGFCRCFFRRAECFQLPPAMQSQRFINGL